MAIDDETLRLARKMRITIDHEVDATIRTLVRAWARSWDEIHGAWADAMMDLASGADNGQWPAPWMVARAERAQAALLAANTEIGALAEFTGVTITDGVGKVIDPTLEQTARIIGSQLPDMAGSKAELAVWFNRVDPASLGWMVERTTEQITSATFALSQVAQEQMRRVLVRGIAVGDNPRTAAREMVRRVGDAFNGGLTRAMTIARTEMLDAHRSAAAAAQFANADVLEGWVWQATLDKGTCPSCWGMHGTVHNLDEVGPNDHQNGRCARLPKTKSWRELGFDIDEPESVLPDADVVFAGLPREDQVTILGPGRMAAYDAGTPLSAMAVRRSTPGWRDSWVPASVKDLAA